MTSYDDRLVANRKNYIHYSYISLFETNLTIYKYKILVLKYFFNNLSRYFYIFNILQYYINDNEK